MILTKLMATLPSRQTPAIVRVTANSHLTPVTRISMIIGPAPSRAFRSLARRHARSLRGCSDNLVSLTDARLGFGDVVADAGERSHHLRLLILRQADQFAATVRPGRARLVEQVDCDGIERYSLFGRRLI